MLSRSEGYSISQTDWAWDEAKTGWKSTKSKNRVLKPSLVNTKACWLFIKQLLKANYSTQQQQYVCITIDISQKYRLYYIDALKAYSVSDRILRKKRYLMYLEFQMLKKWLEELTLRI